MNARAVWFISILFFVVSGNPGADEPTPLRVDINQAIQCDSKPGTAAEQHIVLKANTDKSFRRTLVVNDQLDLNVRCFWKSEVYRCEWSEWYYIEFQVDDTWSPLGDSAVGEWIMLRGLWRKGPLDDSPELIHCGQRL